MKQFKHESKRLAAFLLAAVLLLAALPMAAAEDEAVYRTLYSGEIGTLNYLTTGTTNEFTVSATSSTPWWSATSTAASSPRWPRNGSCPRMT